MLKAKQMWPEVKEFFFDDDTFAWGKNRVLDICQKLKPLKFTWSAQMTPSPCAP